MIRKALLIAASAVAGIYLTSDEGKNARKALQKKKVALEPIIKDLIKQANAILDGTGELNSEQIRANVDLLVNETKKSLIDLDLDKTSETIKDAIRVASRKLSDASNDVEKVKRAETKMKKSPVKAKAQISSVDKKLKAETKTIKPKA